MIRTLRPKEEETPQLPSKSTACGAGRGGGGAWELQDAGTCQAQPQPGIKVNINSHTSCGQMCPSGGVMRVALSFGDLPPWNPQSQCDHEKNIRQVTTEGPPTMSLTGMPQNCQGQQARRVRATITAKGVKADAMPKCHGVSRMGSWNSKRTAGGR